MSNKAFPVSVEAARAALAVIPSDDRDVWWRMGMALKSEFGDDGLRLFEEWSETSSSFDAKAVKSTWKSFKPGGPVTIGTLIAEAKQYGFNPKDFAPAKPMTAADKARVRMEREARDQAVAEELARTQGAAAVEAERVWHAAAIGGASAYLKRKGVHGHGVRYLDDGTVLVPLRDAAGKLWNVQRINAKGEKRFPPGGRVSGCFHLVGDIEGSAWVLIAEGYATAATLHEATGCAVMVAFNEVNMRHVAGAVRQLVPDARLMFCADDDRETESKTGKNPGVASATSAAAAVGGYSCKPEGLAAGATDFNDLARAAGLEEVRTQLEAAFVAAESNGNPNASPAAVAKQGKAVSGAADQQPAAKREGSKGAPRSGAGQAAARAAGQAARPFFNVDEGGVWYHGFSQQGDPLPAQWICSEMHVTAQSRDAANGEWGYLLEFKDGDGNAKRWAMPASMLAGDGTQYRAVLLSMGLRIGAGTAAKNHLTVYIQTQQTDLRVRCTDRIGWHDDVYVMPDRTIGDGEEMVMFQATGGVLSQFKQRGALADWRDEVASLCRGNSRLLFCVSAAFAAPLLHLAHVPSGGFHIWGDSSSGKSTAFKVAGSVFGGKDYPRNWRMTDNALETVAVQHSDALLLLDEIAQVDAKVVGDTVYMLANETGKGRATQTASARKVATWRILFLSDGEVSLANHMEQAGKGVKAGHDVRMAHIAADAGHGLGLYETLNGFASGAALSDYLVSKAHKHYGTAGMAFIEYAVENAAMLAEALQTEVPALARAISPQGAHGQVSRVATRFALVGMAGELATSAGITGWAAGEATEAAKKCFQAWLDGRGGAGNVEHTAILRKVSGFFQAHGEARFVWWHRAMDDHKPNTINRAGFKRLLTRDGTAINTNADHHKEYGDTMHPGEADEVQQEYFVLSEVFRDEICKGLDPKIVTRLLIERGLLMPDSDGGPTRSERLPGIGKARVYRFKPEIAGLGV
jgi:putative DNA primase/helicase